MSDEIDLSAVRMRLGCGYAPTKKQSVALVLEVQDLRKRLAAVEAVARWCEAAITQEVTLGAGEVGYARADAYDDVAKRLREALGEGG